MFRVGWIVSKACRSAGSGISSFSGKSVSTGLLRPLAALPATACNTPRAAFSSILSPSVFPKTALTQKHTASVWCPSSSGLLQHVTPSTSQQPIIRTVTKFSRQSGKRKSVKAVLKRFMRLDWGAWIRTKSGRHKKLWKKTSAQKRRLRQHVLTNSTQSWLLDKMVTSFWRRPKHYVNDPYRPYHSRDEFIATRRKH